MFALKLIRSRAVAAGVLPAGACQSIFSDADDATVAILQAAPPPVGGSAQRRDEDGYPLLGAYPRSAAPQLKDETVKAEQARLNAVADERKSATSKSTAQEYASDIQPLRSVRQEQAATVDKALKNRPKAKAATAKKPATRPEDVLRQIEAGQ